jgi:hypothetical protein
VKHSGKELKQNVEVKDRQKFICAECRKPANYAFKFRGNLFCTATCWMKHYPMTLTGDETRLNEIAADLVKNRCSGRGRKKKS